MIAELRSKIAMEGKYGGRRGFRCVEGQRRNHGSVGVYEA
jgi:hypothetical protein